MIVCCAAKAPPRDLERLAKVPTHLQGGTTLCALGEFAANPVLSTIHQFRDEYERYVSAAPVHESRRGCRSGCIDLLTALIFEERYG